MPDGDGDATAMQSVRTVVIGTGAMAPGIAAEYARLGSTQIAGRDAGKIAAALGVARGALETLAGAGLLDPGEAAEARGRLTGTTIDAADIAGATVVVESIVEDLATKQALFAMLDRAASPTALLCSNTSSLRITAIAADLAHPERVIGTHYWNPPHLLPVVEVIPGEQTAPEMVTAVLALLERMGKEPVRVRREVPGFIWNRLQLAMLRECLWLVSNGGYRHDHGARAGASLVAQWAVRDRAARWAAHLHARCGGTLSAVRRRARRAGGVAGNLDNQPNGHR
jgi:3-hydroxybutyryl-CoA dehydrogenase